jgi:p-hydroxybenzoate 3-monooxygenase
VLERIRAGVLEPGSVELLREVGLGTRLDAEGTPHDGAAIAWAGRGRYFIDTMRWVGKPMTVYGQTNLTEDLYAARDAAGGTVIDEVSDVQIHDLASERPSVTFVKDGIAERVACDYVAGCDGFHGVSRHAIPSSILRTFERAYPFGWLGIMSRTPPYHEMCYVSHERGFALASQRNESLSRYYIQCTLDTQIEDWSDDRFWTEFKARCPQEMADAIVTGPSIEKSMAPLRSFVAEPMQYERLFLVGDAAHIVPPTGAKGLNLAISDVFYLVRGLADVYKNGSTVALNAYSETALRRVWSSERFSWMLTNLLHRFPDESPFDERSKENELDYLSTSEHAQASIAEQYAGRPL